ncbi:MULTISPECIES: hypothetical protein [Niastella]|uniref:DUF4270 domain-containing protein n=1 Tax=Niastella soli TaxID=2821487 RepID=A0ABS3YYN0_9BACT|nr:hypothetical protein [Niastella soli]MBO9202983.1 hypothetical protein [Niastella soli]
MKKNHIILTCKVALATLIFNFTLISCHKDKGSSGEKAVEVEETATINPGAQPTITIPANATVPPTKTGLNFSFNWENAQTMPVVPGQPTVPVPWSDQVVRNYDPGLRYDYKKSDGWELVYNSFSDTLRFPNRVFILYNKFRGVVRYYTYNSTPSNPSVDNYRSLINEVALHGPVSNLLNYADQLIVDVNIKSFTASMIEPWPITDKAWYISQFEMAYDSNLIKLEWPLTSFDWTLDFAQVMELSLNDKNPGNKMIALQKPGNSFITNRGVAIGSNMQAHVKSVSGLDELLGTFSVSTINNLKKTIFDSTAGNKLNATLVPQSGLADSKLDVPASIRINNSLVGYEGTHSMAPPGADNTRVLGLAPLFNEPMGIFYLSAPPVIQHTKADGPLPEQYTLDITSLKYIINPFIQNYVTVRNFRQEIVATATYETSSLTEARLYQGQQLKASAPLTILGVRVSFDVVPKNGSAPIKIIKTFKADLRNS